ncbi:MAG: aspartate aminotransferase family protein [Marinifilaceae bacterium]|jgi:acetylornithine/succinyldiaminopimelate/putrescine aminotransferase|nr:aspartate aminotransferase family protein [Marinifilaceae bacterium]
MINNRQLFLQHVATPSKQPIALEIARAENIYMYTPEGKKYIDLPSGVSVSNIGHGHPHVKKAVKEQVDKFMHLMVYGEFIQSPQSQFAKLLTDQLPENLDSVYFVNSGSEANEGAIKLAKRYTGRSEIISFNNAYHGSTHGALSLLGDENMKQAYRPLLPDIKFIDFNEIDQLNNISDKTAAVILEPIQSEAGLIIPSKNYIQKLREKCNQHNAILIFDEVQMGFGRTGKLFAFEHFDISPDILCLAKAMGGGMPMGAFVAKKEIMDSFKSNPALGHITTFGGHPVSCAAAKASLEVIMDEKLVETADYKGKLFVDKICSHECVKTYRQIGLFVAIELKSEKDYNKIIELGFERGLIMDPFLFKPNCFRIAPALNITEEQINEISDIIIDCMNKL